MELKNKRGRPPGKKRRQVSICLPDNTRQAAKKAAFDENLSLSQFVDQAIWQKLNFGRGGAR